MNKPLKISLIVLVVLIVLYITLKFTAEWYITNQVTKKINKDNQLFQVKIENTRVHLFNQMVDLYGISLKPVEAKNSSIGGSVDHITLGSFDITNFVFNEIIEAEVIKIENPELNFSLQKSDKKKESKSSGGMFSQNIFDKIKVNKILIQNADFDLSGSMNANLTLKSFSLENIVLDSASVIDKVPFNYDSAIVQIDSLSLQPDSLYRLSTGQITLARNQLKISDFRYSPQFSKSEYASVYPMRKPRYDVYINDLTFDSLHWKLPGGAPMQFLVGNLDMDSLNLEMYIDKNVPRNADKKRPMPSHALKNAPFLLTIHQINANNSKYTYQIQPKDAPETANLFFTNLVMDASNITNDSSILAENPTAKFNFDAHFMGAGALKASFNFNIAQQDFPFSAKGNLDPMNFAALNQLIAPLMSMEVDGTLNNMTYDFSGNNKNASGTVDMAYQNMQLVFKEEPGESAPILKALSSLIVNNNLKRQNSSQAEVSFSKAEERSFFYYWWSGIRKGVKQIVLP